MTAVAAPQAPLVRVDCSPLTQVCHACGITTDTALATSFVYRGEASFCLRCWETLPASAIRQVVQAVQLRGVPLS